MSCIHFKFKNWLDYDTLIIDGLHISAADLKQLISERVHIGKEANTDLQLINAQTKEAYCDDDCLIPRNTSVVVARIPAAVSQKLPKTRNNLPVESAKPNSSNAKDEVPLDDSLTEEEKLALIMFKSTERYHRANYARKAVMTGKPPPSFICNQCGQTGHWINKCPNPRLIRGVPSYELAPAPADHPFAYQTKRGNLVINKVNENARKNPKKERPPFLPVPDNENSRDSPSLPLEVPLGLRCPLCKELFSEAVIIACCGASFCDDCIRNRLLENNAAMSCPECEREGVSPDYLVPNLNLRNMVLEFIRERDNPSANSWRSDSPRVRSASPEVIFVKRVDAKLKPSPLTIQLESDGECSRPTSAVLGVVNEDEDVVVLSHTRSPPRPGTATPTLDEPDSTIAAPDVAVQPTSIGASASAEAVPSLSTSPLVVPASTPLDSTVTVSSEPAQPAVSPIAQSVVQSNDLSQRQQAPDHAEPLPPGVSSPILPPHPVPELRRTFSQFSVLPPLPTFLMRPMVSLRPESQTTGFDALTEFRKFEAKLDRMKKHARSRSRSGSLSSVSSPESSIRRRRSRSRSRHAPRRAELRYDSRRRHRHDRHRRSSRPSSALSQRRSSSPATIDFNRNFPPSRDFSMPIRSSFHFAPLPSFAPSSVRSFTGSFQPFLARPPPPILHQPPPFCGQFDVRPTTAYRPGFDSRTIRLAPYRYNSLQDTGNFGHCNRSPRHRSETPTQDEVPDHVLADAKGVVDVAKVLEERKSLKKSVEKKRKSKAKSQASVKKTGKTRTKDLKDKPKSNKKPKSDVPVADKTLLTSGSNTKALPSLVASMRGGSTPEMALDHQEAKAVSVGASPESPSQLPEVELSVTDHPQRDDLRVSSAIPKKEVSMSENKPVISTLTASSQKEKRRKHKHRRHHSDKSKRKSKTSKSSRTIVVGSVDKSESRKSGKNAKLQSVVIFVKPADRKSRKSTSSRDKIHCETKHKKHKSRRDSSSSTRVEKLKIKSLVVRV